MKKITSILLILLLSLSLASCGKAKVDFADAATFEAALNSGEDVEGKVVTFVVNEVVPDSAFGYNLQAGEHLNFCSENNPKVKKGDSITVKVTEVTSMLGSYIISYKIVK